MAGLTCSIIIPVFNQSDAFLEKALVSAAKCYSDETEILVVDSGSSMPISELFLSKYSFVKFSRFENNLGLFANWNRAMTLSQSRFIWFLCSDDEIVPETFSFCLNAIKRSPNTAMVASAGQVVLTDGQKVERIGQAFAQGVYNGPSAGRVLLAFNASTSRNPFPYPSGILMRRETLARVGYFDGEMKHIGDIDLYYRMLAHGDLHIVSAVGCLITRHPSQAGNILGGNVFGLEEYQKMIGKIPYLDSKDIALSKQKFLVFSLFYALDLFVKGRSSAAKINFEFFLKNASWWGMWRFGQMVISKLFASTSVGRKLWQKRLLASVSQVK